jgi:hypothetical protein
MRWLFREATTSFSLLALFPPHQQKSYVALHGTIYGTADVYQCICSKGMKVPANQNITIKKHLIIFFQKCYNIFFLYLVIFRQYFTKCWNIFLKRTYIPVWPIAGDTSPTGPLGGALAPRLHTCGRGGASPLVTRRHSNTGHPCLGRPLQAMGGGGGGRGGCEDADHGGSGGVGWQLQLMEEEGDVHKRWKKGGARVRRWDLRVVSCCETQILEVMLEKIFWKVYRIFPIHIGKTQDNGKELGTPLRTHREWKTSRPGPVCTGPSLFSCGSGRVACELSWLPMLASTT